MMSPIIITNQGRFLKVYTRDETENLKVFDEKEFSPYFYYEDPQGEYVAIDGKKVTKCIVNNPKDVRSRRVYFENKRLKIYEADIPYIIRYSIDKYDTPWAKTPLRICYFDIEVLDSLDTKNAPKPIVSITAYDNFDKKYYTFILGDEECVYKFRDGFILEFKEEKSMLNKFVSFIQKRDPDLLVAWNIRYDINYLVNRMIKLGLDPNMLSRENNIWIKDGKVWEIKGRVVVDLMELYKKLKAKNLESYSLENVADYEGLPIRKLKRKEILEMSKWELIVYNKRDVEIIVTLDQKLGIISFWDELRRFVGLPWNVFFNVENGISNKKLVDVYLLRKAKKKGFILPSVQEQKRESYEGALVLTPRSRVFKNVIVLDIKSMYPNIIRTYNLSPETLDNNQGEINTPIGYKFRKNPIGLIPEACSELFELRKQYKKKMKEYLREGNDEKAKEFDDKQRSVKIILNSMYGVMAYPGFRLFKKEVAETVTAFGRELLKHIINVVENQGFEVIYGDTDSVFVKFPDSWDKEKCLQEANKLIEHINNSFNDFVRKWDVDKHYHEIELKFIFDRIAFFGVKKRYAGYFVNEEGVWKEGFEVKGLEIVRSDTPEITKETLNKVLEMLLIENTNPKEILEYINEIKTKIKLGEIPIEKLVFKVSFNPEKEYKQENIAFLRGLKFAMKEGIVDTLTQGKLAWIYIKHPNSDVITVPENKIEVLNKYSIDYAKCEERWFGNIERLLEKLINGSNTIIKYVCNKSNGIN